MNILKTEYEYKAFERCLECVCFDRERSSDLFVVCDDIPIDVMLVNTSKNCKRFKQRGKL